MTALLSIKRTQYPVGQGGFHACEIGLKNSDSKYIYVYDCGSTSKQNIERSIDEFEEYLDSRKKIDALFISHLDKDHIHGIESLLNKVDIKKIYLPYLNKISAILYLLAMQKTRKGSLTEIIEAIFESQEYFEELAKASGKEAPEVILVEPSDSEEAYDELDREPDDEPGGEIEIDYMIRSIPPEITHGHRKHIEPTKQRIEFEAEAIANSGVVKNKYLNWILLPHVTSVKPETEKKFKQKFLKAPCIRKLGIKNLSDINTENAKKLFSDRRCITAVRDIYKTIEDELYRSSKDEHNLISMSLYSGPMNKTKSTFSYQLWKGCFANQYPWNLLHSHFLIFSRYPTLFSYLRAGRAVGWIGTGDANLKHQNFLDSFWNKYNKFTKFVVTLHLPHHGSRYSSDEKLLNKNKFPNLIQAIANARINNIHHPSIDIMNIVSEAEIYLLQVSEDNNSTITEEIYQIF